MKIKSTWDESSQIYTVCFYTVTDNTVLKCRDLSISSRYGGLPLIQVPLYKFHYIIFFLLLELSGKVLMVTVDTCGCGFHGLRLGNKLYLSWPSMNRMGGKGNSASTFFFVRSEKPFKIKMKETYAIKIFLI